MKHKEMVESLIEVAKSAGIKIHRSTGKFKSGACMVNEEPAIVLNRTAGDEAMARILACSLNSIGIEDVFIKPAVREFIEEQSSAQSPEKEFQLNIE